MTRMPAWRTTSCEPRRGEASGAKGGAVCFSQAEGPVPPRRPPQVLLLIWRDRAELADL
jgi:hypothetical protein